MTKQLKYLVIALLPLVLGNAAQAGLKDGLMAYYPLDGDVSDASGNGNHGVIHGDVTTVAGFDKTGKAMHIGAGGYVSVPDSPTLNSTTGKITVAFWIKPSATTVTWAPILHKGGASGGGCDREYEVYLSSDGTLYWGNAAQGGCEESLLSYGNPMDEWLFVVGTTDRVAGTIKLYVNNQLKNYGSVTIASLNDAAGDLNLGWVGGGYGQFIGRLDELRIYDRILTRAEMATLYNPIHPVSGRIESLPKYNLTCTNQITGQSVSVDNLRGKNWDCEAQGLVVSPGQRVEISITGVNQ